MDGFTACPVPPYPPAPSNDLANEGCSPRTISRRTKAGDTRHRRVPTKKKRRTEVRRSFRSVRSDYFAATTLAISRHLFE